MGAQATQGALGEWYEANPLRAYRRTSQRTIADIASAIGFDVSMINRWEIGFYTPKFVAITKLAAEMGIEASELLANWYAWDAKRPEVITE